MRFITVFLLFQRSDRQDLDRCRFRCVTELSGRIEPGQASHIEVEQDQRRQHITRGGDTIYPVSAVWTAKPQPSKRVRRYERISGASSMMRTLPKAKLPIPMSLRLLRQTYL